ncbi:MAG: GtrA family protein [Paludibacter sp.]|nr:GtrA family protein [Paludibacter sp.]
MLVSYKAFVRKNFEFIGKKITTLVDFFYPPFRKYINLPLFRYAATGGSNVVFDWILFFLTFHYILDKQLLHLGPITLSSYIAAKFIVFPITFTTGFLLQKYVTFQASTIKGRKQFMRYFNVVLGNLLINYLGLKLLIDIIGIDYPSIANVIVTIFTVIFSYLSQKKYTFRIKKHD